MYSYIYAGHIFKINSVNAEWCNIQSCINCKSLLMMCKISAKCTTLDYILLMLRLLTRRGCEVRFNSIFSIQKNLNNIFTKKDNLVL
ncbi:hypothetical protein BpHYR1_003701 [Brachionus plicatilis]|uniref:Uncharacterized protein n=1 Tax=Brachionus plicatilis TaxID=10195 RepID=A0A3M7RDV9_BRAPC|nr:hypothetical protein BpHYR1_003701 [Brachionus plicatilis]